MKQFKQAPGSHLTQDYYNQLFEIEKQKQLALLASRLAHDFNNILTVIQGYSEMYAFDSSIPESLRSAFSEIYESSQKGSILTSQVQAFARQDTQKLETISLKKFLQENKPKIEKFIGRKNQLVLNLPETEISTEINAGQLIQVISTLATNAAESFRSDGILTISVGVAEAPLNEEIIQKYDLPARNYIQIEVTDNGSGIAENIQDKIFDPFFSTKPNGTGIGLSIISAVIKKAKGAIDFWSKPDVGSCFRIFLPQQHMPDEMPEDPQSSVADMTDFGTLNPAELRVTVAEDNVTLANMLGSWLSQRGFHVDIFHSSMDASCFFDEFQEKIDLLITDIEMPEMTGDLLAENFQLMQPEGKIIYISGFTNNEFIRRRIKNGHINFLGKPFNQQQLFEMVYNTLR